MPSVFLRFAVAARASMNGDGTPSPAITIWRCSRLGRTRSGFAASGMTWTFSGVTFNTSQISCLE